MVLSFLSRLLSKGSVFLSFCLSSVCVCFRVLFCWCKKISGEREMERIDLVRAGVEKTKVISTFCRYKFSSLAALFDFWLFFCWAYDFFIFSFILFYFWCEAEMLCFLSLSVFVFWLEAIGFDLYWLFSLLMAVDVHIIYLVDMIYYSFH